MVQCVYMELILYERDYDAAHMDRTVIYIRDCILEVYHIDGNTVVSVLRLR